MIKGSGSTATGSPQPGSFGIWKVDFTSTNINADGSAHVSKIADIPEAGILDGLTLVQEGCEFVLAADSVLGLVWRINVQTGEYVPLAGYVHGTCSFC